jgi:hypothetical protein
MTMTQLGYGGSDVVTIGTLGTVIGDSATDTVGFFGATPVARQALVTTVTTGETVMAAAINSIIDRLQNLGLLTGP